MACNKGQFDCSACEWNDSFRFCREKWKIGTVII